MARRSHSTSGARRPRHRRSRGIGRAIALLLARHGATVAVASRKPEAAKRSPAEIRAAGGRATAHACQSASRRKSRRPCRRSKRARPDRHPRQQRGHQSLLRSGARHGSRGLAEDRGRQHPRLLLGSIEAARRMQRAGQGRDRQRGLGERLPADGRPGLLLLTKAAIVNMTQGLAKEWARDGIRVNALVPGIVETRFAAAIHEERDCAPRSSARCRWAHCPAGRDGGRRPLPGVGCCVLHDGQLPDCGWGLARLSRCRSGAIQARPCRAGTADCRPPRRAV